MRTIGVAAAIGLDLADEMAGAAIGKPLPKEGYSYVYRTDVEEVVLNASVLEGNRLVQDLKRENFQVFEDGVKQAIVSFQHTDLPVSIALVIDNSGSMRGRMNAGYGGAPSIGWSSRRWMSARSGS